MHPLSRSCTALKASAVFIYILEAVFSEGVQRRLRFCLYHLSCDKTVAFEFYFQWRKRETKDGWETIVMLILVKRSLLIKKV
jgi:hypothetical protein